MRLTCILAVSLLLCACNEGGPLEVLANEGSPGLKCTTVEELAALPEEDLDLGRAALVIQDDFTDRPGYQAALDELDALALGFGRPASDDATREGQRLLDYLYDECGFVYGVGSREADSRLLERVLETRQGNCVGLSTLYLAVAERVGLELSGVVIPGHMYVVLERGGELVGLEPTSGGLYLGADGPDSGLLDDDYREASRFGVPLTKRETIGELLVEAAQLSFDSYYALSPVPYARWAVEFAPRFPRAHRTLASVLGGSEDEQELLDAIDRALELNPRDTAARIQRAQYYMSRGLQDRALPDLLAAVETDPGHPLPHWLLARAHAERFEFDEMFEVLDRALATPWDSFTPEYRAYLELTTGERSVFEGLLWGYLAEQHAYLAERLVLMAKEGDTVDQAEMRLQLASADLAARTAASLGQVEVQESEITESIDANPALREHPRIVRYRAALASAKERAARTAEQAKK